MDASQPIACILSAADYPARLAGLATIRGEGVPRIRQISDGVEMTFTDTRKMRANLESFIAAESECCSFMSFDLAPKGANLILTITAPPDGLPIVGELASAFTTGAVNQ